MDLESQMAFTTKSRTVPNVSASDKLTEILFSFNPAFMYQWIADYGSTASGPKLETIPHLCQYWNNLLRQANIPGLGDLFTPDMSDESFLETFQNQALPILRNNRKLLNHVSHH